MVDRERLLSTFFALAALDSPSYDERDTVDFVLERLHLLGMTPTEDDAAAKIGGRAGNVLATLDGVGEPRLFAAHLDTVTPCKGKKILVGETITSDGSTILGADDLAAVAAILEAVTVILENNLPHYPLELLFTVAEEVYSKGAGVFDYSKIRAKLAFVPDYDGPIGAAVTKAPTLIAFTAQMRGRAAHAGFAPEKGISAIVAASAAISKLKLGRIDLETTVNVGLIQGGAATNIVPETCTVHGEVRSYCHEKALAQTEKIKQVFLAQGICDFTGEICIRAYDHPENAPVTLIFKNACQRTGLKPELYASFGGSDNNSFAQRGIQGIVLASAMHACHTTGEFTSAPELEKLTELLINLMMEGA